MYSVLENLQIHTTICSSTLPGSPDVEYAKVNVTTGLPVVVLEILVFPLLPPVRVIVFSGDVAVPPFEPLNESLPNITPRCSY